MNAEEVMRRAAAVGSTCKTLKGAVKYLLAHRQHVIPLPLPRCGYQRKQWEEENWHRSQKAEWQAAQIARKADPEAKRARHDKAFRRKWLAALTREAKALAHPSLETLDDILTAADNLDARSLRTGEIDRLRKLAGATGPAYAVRPAMAGVVITAFTADEARKAGATIDMQGKDAHLEACRRASHGNHSAGVTHWKNGRPHDYDRAMHSNYIRSVGLLLADGSFDYVFHETRVRAALPQGFSFEVRDGKLYAIHKGIEIQPRAVELLKPGAVVKNLLAALEARIAEAETAIAHAAGTL